VVDPGATRHICGDRNAFTSYTLVGDREEHVYLGDSSTTPVLGKRKVLLKLTSRKTLALTNVLHVPSIRVNLVYVPLLGKVGIKVSFESDKIVMTKNKVFVGKGYCDQGLFVLNIYEIGNESTSSFAYLIDSYYLWQARLGHLNSSYVFKMQNLGIIILHDKQYRKCELCVECKITKNTCYLMQCEFEPLCLIHIDLVELK